MLGLPEEPTNQFLLGMVANSQCCQSPFHGQSQQEQQSQVGTRQPRGVCHVPEHLCNIDLPGPRVPALPGARTGTDAGGVMGEGSFGGAILQKPQELQSQQALLF